MISILKSSLAFFEHSKINLITHKLFLRGLFDHVAASEEVFADGLGIQILSDILALAIFAAVNGG
jgi:hypothetical protein